MSAVFPLLCVLSIPYLQEGAGQWVLALHTRPPLYVWPQPIEPWPWIQPFLPGWVFPIPIHLLWTGVSVPFFQMAHLWPPMGAHSSSEGGGGGSWVGSQRCGFAPYLQPALLSLLSGGVPVPGYGGSMGRTRRAMRGLPYWQGLHVLLGSICPALDD